MLFNTLSYFIFLTLVFILYYTIATRYRWVLLLAASYFFYMCWNPAFLILIVLSSFSVYFIALQLEKEQKVSKRKCLLWIGILFNLSILGVFKYAGFFQTLLTDLKIISTGQTLQILLPVGISFYTFQALGYLIDVYRKQMSAEQHPGYFALFISFFPQLVAGPIERASRLLPQLKNKDIRLENNHISAGVKYLIYGLFKKVVVADNLALFVNEVFQNISQYNGFHYLVAAVLFTFQIYCDFSAYSDMAVGSARLLGIRLMQNFNLPFQAASLADFWKKWHISLSTWFRDYVFLPLAWKFSKLSLFKNNTFLSNILIYSLSVIITFFLTGLWHGANYTFIVWGLLHGFYLIFEFSTKKIRLNLYKSIGFKKTSFFFKWISSLIIFSFVVFAFVFFRSASLREAWVFIRQIFSEWSSISWPELSMKSYFIGGIAGLMILLFIELLMKNKLPEFFLSGKPTAWRWAFFYFLLAFVFMAGNFGNIEFIYFQF